jgi:RND family efflux transporter MFP subunit
MDDKTSLLTQLRIDRGEEIQTDDAGKRWVLWSGSVVLVLALAAGLWWFVFRPSGVPVTVAEVRASSNTSPAAAGSLLDASGYVIARRQATVASKTTGRVVEVLIEEGQRVEKDEIIAQLDDSNTRANLSQSNAQLAQAVANLEAAKVALDDARPIFERSKLQFERNVISADDFDKSKAAFNAAQSDYAVRDRALSVARSTLAMAQRNQDDMTVRAPFTGVVTVKAAQAGEMVSPVSAGGGYTRTGIGTIVDMDSLEVEVDVSESFINRVKPKQPATIKLNAYPDWEIPAEVIAVVPTADRSKATVKVRVGFKERDARVLPEMGARVSFLADPSKASANAAPVSKAYIVGTDAIEVSGDTGTVFVLKGNTVERRVVRVGARTSDGQIVLSGLAEGEQLAVGDRSLLTDGVRVQVQK